MFSEINEKITANTGMKGKKQIDIIKTNKPFSIRVLYIRYGVYDIVFTYQETTVFQPISDEQYREYRKLCYLRPIRAKNYLLDLVNFDGTPYCRGDFQFIGKDDEPRMYQYVLPTRPNVLHWKVPCYYLPNWMHRNRHQHGKDVPRNKYLA